MKTKNNSKDIIIIKTLSRQEDIIKRFEELGFEHTIVNKPMMSYNHLLNIKDNTGFTFLWLFDKLTIQNKDGTSLVINKEQFQIEYSREHKALIYKNGKTLMFILNIDVEDLKQ